LDNVFCLIRIFLLY